VLGKERKGGRKKEMEERRGEELREGERTKVARARERIKERVSLTVRGGVGEKGREADVGEKGREKMRRGERRHGVVQGTMGEKSSVQRQRVGVYMKGVRRS
jgi:hypothetical protein